VLLIDVLWQRLEELFAAQKKQGTVTAIVGTKVDVTVDGSVMRLPRYKHYTPTVGDVVDIDASRRGAWIVLGTPA
jgi:ribosomal protein L21E